MTLDEQQERDWPILHDRVTAVLDRFGKKDPFGKGDYWILGENWGRWQLEVEAQNLSLLGPAVIDALQRALTGYPDWRVTVRVAVAGKDWPGMGVIVYGDEIVDDLQRQYLPEEFRSIQYSGKVRVGSLRS
jgi:hypothetical protein